MLSLPGRVRGAFAFVLCAAVPALVLLAPGGSAAAGKARGCGAFDHQADAQAYYLEIGGSPARPDHRLDPDRDGVACEGLPAPYAGYATIGYNRKRGFLYGSVTMPHAGGEEPYPCLTGNVHGPEGPRLYNVYRVGGRHDHPIFPGAERGAAALPTSGRLIWRADRRALPRGRYYVGFEERIRMTPYGRNECPAFSSAPVALPSS